MILKFIEAPLLSSKDEAEAIGKLNEFLAELGKKPAQENKVELEEEVKVRVWLVYTHSLYIHSVYRAHNKHTHIIRAHIQHTCSQHTIQLTHSPIPNTLVYGNYSQSLD